MSGIIFSVSRCKQTKLISDMETSSDVRSGHYFLNGCKVNKGVNVKVKIFNFDSSYAGLESKVNKWLDKNDVEIFKILQSESDNSLTVTIFYKDAE